MSTFRLIPYPASGLPKINITGEAIRVENQLSIRYEVAGEIDQIILPAPSSTPTRKDDLWKATCFEFFIAIPGQPQYWEFNMSPLGDWNVYKMDAYRRIGFREETAISHLLFEFKKTNERVSLNTTVDLTPIFSPSQNLQMSVTAIIQTKDGNETYWASIHPGPQADFHSMESFILTM